MSNTNQRLIIESNARALFNRTFGTEGTKERVTMPGGYVRHEFDMYQPGKLVGGISTSPWRNEKRGTNNTGGQDRAFTEIALLNYWDGPERRVHLLTDLDMATNLCRRLRGIPMKAPIEIHHFSINDKALTLVGTLGA